MSRVTAILTRSSHHVGHSDLVRVVQSAVQALLASLFVHVAEFLNGVAEITSAFLLFILFLSLKIPVEGGYEIAVDVVALQTDWEAIYLKMMYTCEDKNCYRGL